MRGVLHRQRRTRLALLRLDWGQRGSRTHKLDVLDETHHDRAVHLQERVLDQRTADDLMLGKVFAELDRTTSTLGRDALYHRLHTLGSVDDADDLEALATRFAEDPAARERAQLALARLQDPNGYDVWWLQHAEAIPHHAWHAAFPALSLLTVMAIASAMRWYTAWQLVPILLAVNLAVWFMARREIGALILALRQVAPIVTTGEELAFLEPRVSPLIAHIRDDARAMRRLKRVARWLSGDPLMLSFRLEGIALAITAVATIVYEYANIALLLDANGVRMASSDLRRHGATLMRLTKAIGDVDTALSVASWRAERTQWSQPHFTSHHSAVRLENLRHPLVADAVPNTLELPLGRGLVITGSNMSGKSTFLRTVGVSVVLAQRLNTALASHYEAPFFSVRSCIGRTDDLMSGKSYYLAEVEAVLALVRAAKAPEPHLFLFDELLRGTNTIERVSAGAAVLSALVEPSGNASLHIVLSASHDGELVDLLRDAYDACHFSDTIGPEGLRFDFQMKAGPSTTRNAIALLAQCGASAEIVERAAATAAAMEQRTETAS